MSQSPFEVGQESDAQRQAFQAANRHLNDLTFQGVSWSGRERHCAFLNTGGRRFANVSAISGFDFLNDGRGLALTDWDHDGDLDVWTTNRDAPRVRFLRNDMPAGGHFLAVRLEGRECNRDAIGARVELFAGNQKSQIENHKLIRTLRAGEGFVSQSSKWLHFGLGSAEHVEKLVVRWPDGAVETIDGLEADRFVRIVQGTGRAENWTPPKRRIELAASSPAVPETTGKIRTVLSSPCPAPPVEYTDVEGRIQYLDAGRKGPSLVNLWASWCLPCAAELRSITEHEPALRSAGLDVVALSVDGLGDGRGDKAAAAKLMTKLGFPFTYGFAGPATVDRLQVLNDFLMQWRRPLPVPTSFLIDARGRVAVIYKGPVEVDELLNDVKLLGLDDESLLAAAFPFPGRWFRPLDRYGLEPLAKRLIKKGHLEALTAWALRDADRLNQEPDFKNLLITLGNELAEKGDLKGATAQFRAAVREDPQLAVGHRNLGSALLRQDRAVEAVESFREAARLDPEDAVHQLNLGSTLARLKRLDAAAVALRRAVELDPRHVEAHRNLGLVYEKQVKLPEAVEVYRAYLELKGDDTFVRRKLGLFLARLGKLDDAAAQLEQVVTLTPSDAAALCDLGRVEVARGRIESGIAIYKRAIAVAPDLADAHHLLADAHLRQGELGVTAASYRRALELEPRRVSAANNLAWILASGSDAEVRNGKEAVRWAEHCAALRGKEHVDVLDALAAAYAEAGRFEDATATAGRAVARLREKGPSAELTELEQRLKLYEEGKPYRR